ACTSVTTALPSGISISTALNRSGSWSGGNSTSTTVPMICATRPSATVCSLSAWGLRHPPNYHSIEPLAIGRLRRPIRTLPIVRTRRSGRGPQPVVIKLGEGIQHHGRAVQGELGGVFGADTDHRHAGGRGGGNALGRVLDRQTAAG